MVLTLFSTAKLVWPAALARGKLAKGLRPQSFANTPVLKSLRALALAPFCGGGARNGTRGRVRFQLGWGGPGFQPNVSGGIRAVRATGGRAGWLCKKAWTM